MVKIKMGKSN